MTITWRVDRSQLRPEFADDIDGVLGPDDAHWYVTQGKRDSAYQQTLYDKYLAGGPRAAPPGKSAHEFGLAVDVTLVRNGKDVWDYEDPDWRRLVAKVKAHPRLHSLDAIGDTDHVERVDWKRIAEQVSA